MGLSVAKWRKAAGAVRVMEGKGISGIEISGKKVSLDILKKKYLKDVRFDGKEMFFRGNGAVSTEELKILELVGKKNKNPERKINSQIKPCIKNDSTEKLRGKAGLLLEAVYGKKGKNVEIKYRDDEMCRICVVRKGKVYVFLRYDKKSWLCTITEGDYFYDIETGIRVKWVV